MGMHQPVLLEETVAGLLVRPGGQYVDATLGAAGHAEAIMALAGEKGRLLGLDRDGVALERARVRLAPWEKGVTLLQASFERMGDVAVEAGFKEVDGVLMDLGISSDQLDDPKRGFSFMHDGPLDMRMDPSQGPTAAEWLASVEEKTLAWVLRHHAEERRANRIARTLVHERKAHPLRTTAELAKLVEDCTGGRRGQRLHPATRTFMAIRMAVNRELESLEQGLAGGLRLLRPGGRMAVITFHSVEDRMVKQFGRKHEGRMASLAEGGERWEGEEPRLRRVNRKPLVASSEEISRNPRARSAKLRVFERAA
jgi:16S rRNA (cytosine1402-N4)-methyltransferase